MNKAFEHLHKIRTQLKNLLLEPPADELAYIADGFNNNMYWNIAHCIATQQLLHYYLSGNSFRIDNYWVESFKKGTLPQLSVREDEIEDLAFLLTKTSDILVADYDAGYFKEYQKYTTSFGIELKSIEDALLFNNLHESLHLGYVMAQSRAILGEKMKR